MTRRDDYACILRRQPWLAKVLGLLLVCGSCPGTASAKLCTASRACQPTICQYTMAAGPQACSTPTLTGLGTADVQGLGMTWLNLNLTGSDPSLGAISLTLDPSRTSTGYLTVAGFPATNRIDFYFRISTQALGTLTSAEPIRLEAVVNAIPPTATYHLLAPVDLYHVNDLNGPPVAALTAATVDVTPGGTVPGVRGWSAALIAAAVLTGGTVVLRRRRYAS